jgi:hypothetical protein
VLAFSFSPPSSLLFPFSLSSLFHISFPVMSDPIAPIPRTGSLSVPSSAVPSYLRRSSEAMLSDGPLTPPASPSPSAEGGDDDRADITVDAQPRFSAPRADPVSPRPSYAPKALSREQEMSRQQAEAQPKPPQRFLDDEKSHVHKTSITLKDFEVRGTLGELPLSLPDFRCYGSHASR